VAQESSDGSSWALLRGGFVLCPPSENDPRRRRTVLVCLPGGVGPGPCACALKLDRSYRSYCIRVLLQRLANYTITFQTHHTFILYHNRQRTTGSVPLSAGRCARMRALTVVVAP
jgi:hypothetical protein